VWEGLEDNGKIEWEKMIAKMPVTK